MSAALVRRRERIARVRRVEHLLAAGAAAQADAQLEQLRASEARLTDIRCSLSSSTGAFAAETLAARAELALRLDEARFGLVDAIATAQALAEQRRAERVEARKRQESAEKLGERAAADTARAAARRADAAAPARGPRGLGEQA